MLKNKSFRSEAGKMFCAIQIDFDELKNVNEDLPVRKFSQIMQSVRNLWKMRISHF